MQIPDFQKLSEERRRGQGECSSYVMGMHPNPRFYKYYWWVFCHRSPEDGSAFLTRKYRLATAIAMALVEELKAQKEPYWIYNEKVMRRDAASPFDPTAPCLEKAEWAVAFDEDSDPIWNGHK